MPITLEALKFVYSRVKTGTIRMGSSGVSLKKNFFDIDLSFGQICIGNSKFLHPFPLKGSSM